MLFPQAFQDSYSRSSASIIAKALGGRKVGAGWMARCPAHLDQDPSLSVREGANGKVLVHCHAGCKQERVISELRSLGLWDRAPKYSAPTRHGLKQSVVNQSAANRLRAQVLWQEAAPVVSTIAAQYLASRKINAAVINDVDGDVLRFHPVCPYDGSKRPCLLALMRDLFTNEPRAIQRTALTRTGQKISRMTLGPKTGAAIKLSSDENVAMGLAVGEGLETMLSATQLGFRPAWALIDAKNVGSFPALSGIECLTIIVDNDENCIGQQAALECSDRWTNAGREVFRVVPDRHGEDLNNILQRTSP
jgi:putative DNA primase/helicase